MVRLFAGAVVVVGLFSLGCAGDGETFSGDCTPGVRETCECGEELGERFCLSEGRWTACSCEALGNGGSGGTGGFGGSGGSADSGGVGGTGGLDG